MLATWEQHARGERYNAEVKQLLDNGIQTTKEFNDLPIVHTGCDTYASIIQFKHFNMLKSVDEVVEHLLVFTRVNGLWIMVMMYT